MTATWVPLLFRSLISFVHRHKTSNGQPVMMMADERARYYPHHYTLHPMNKPARWAFLFIARTHNGVVLDTRHEQISIRTIYVRLFKSFSVGVGSRARHKQPKKEKRNATNNMLPVWLLRSTARTQQGKTKTNKTSSIHRIRPISIFAIAKNGVWMRACAINFVVQLPNSIEPADGVCLICYLNLKSNR